MQRVKAIHEEIRKSALKILVGLGGWGLLYMFFMSFFLVYCLDETKLVNERGNSNYDNMKFQPT